MKAQRFCLSVGEGVAVAVVVDRFVRGLAKSVGASHRWHLGGSVLTVPATDVSRVIS
jgi:hypothetical protein